jgi:hypothetical protein
MPFSCRETPKLGPQQVRLVAVAQCLAQGDAGQGIVLHGVAGKRLDPIHLAHPRARHAARCQGDTVGGEPFGIGVQGGRSDEAFAPEHLEDRPIDQPHDLVAMTVCLKHLGIVAQGQVVLRVER